MQPRAMRRAWRQDMRRRATTQQNRPAVGDRESQHRGPAPERYTMETETETPNLLLQVGTSGEWFVIAGRSLAGPQGHKTTHVTLEDLQAIVQQAYDQHGIVAQLWTDSTTNADRDQSGCNGTEHCPATAAHHFDCQAVQG